MIIYTNTSTAIYHSLSGIFRKSTKSPDHSGPLSLNRSIHETPLHSNTKISCFRFAESLRLQKSLKCSLKIATSFSGKQKPANAMFTGVSRQCSQIALPLWRRWWDSNPRIPVGINAFRAMKPSVICRFLQ